MSYLPARVPAPPVEPPLIFGFGPPAEEAGDTAMALALGALAPEIEASPTLHRASESVRTVARRLPRCELFAFEIRLSSSSAQVDLALRLPRAPIVLSPEARPIEAWRCVAEFAGRACDPGSPVRAVDLEFDLPTDRPSDLMPRLFVGLREGEGHDSRLNALVEELTGGSELAETLERCRGALPPSGKLIHLGRRFEGPPNQLRLVATAVPAAHLSSFLERLCWPLPVGDVLAPLSALREGRIDLALDFRGRDLVRVGFECFPNPRRSNRGVWEPLLSSLERSSLCSPAQADEFVRWTGTTRWSRAGGSAALLEIFRFPSHVKVAQSRHGEVAAKAYLAVKMRAS